MNSDDLLLSPIQKRENSSRSDFAKCSTTFHFIKNFHMVKKSGFGKNNSNQNTSKVKKDT